MSDAEWWDVSEFVDTRSKQERQRDALTTRLNDVVNDLAGRDDLLLDCVWDKPLDDPSLPGAPAWFTPSRAQVTVNASYALQGRRPETVEPRTAAGRRANPVIVGLMCHEAGHAHSTLWSDSTLDGGTVTPALRKAAVLLEEPRIEHRQLQRRPDDLPFLRAQSALIDLEPFVSGNGPGDDAGPWALGACALMTLGRRDAGVLQAADVAPVEPLLRARLGSDVLDGLREVWVSVLSLTDGDVSGLLAAAERWNQVLGDPPQGTQVAAVACAADGDSDDADDGASPAEGDSAPGDEHDPGGYQSDGAGDEGGGTGAGQPDTDSTAADGDNEDAPGADSPDAPSDADLAEALTDLLQDVAALGAVEVDIAAKQDEKGEQRLQAVEDAELQKKAQEVAASLLSGRRRAAPGRAPLPQERALANSLASALRRAQFRERATTRARSDTPPGRLDGRDAMLGAAQRARRDVVTARPFRQTVRRRVPEPPLTVGTMIDVSASMQWATKVLPSLAWAFSHAVHSIHGTAATVAFGSQVTPLVLPGSPAVTVPFLRASDDTEQFAEGFAVIDGALNLTRGQGARVLVIVSDGFFVGPGQLDASRDAIARLVRNRAHLLWVHPADAVLPEQVTPIPFTSVDALPGQLEKALATVVATTR